MTRELIRKVSCLECKQEAQLIRDVSGDVYEGGDVVLECLNKECLWWEYYE